MESLVSIITPNFNCDKYIAETIMSVINQSYEKWELIIIDDCSTDNSVEIIQNFQNKDKRVKLITLNQNSGPAICRKKGIELAGGDFLTFIDSDDLWLNNFIEVSLNKIRNTDGFVYSSYHRYDKNLNAIYKDFIVPNSVTYSDILKTNSISCLTAFIDIKKLGKLYMPNIKYRQDMGLWLQYLKKIDRAEGISTPLAIYRIRKGSHSRNKFKLIKPQWFFYRNVENLSFEKSLIFIIYWMLNGVKKYYS